MGREIVTARVAVLCDGFWDSGRMPCRAAYSTSTTDETTARLAAVAHGWAAHPTDGDLCPAHARIRREATT